MDWTKAQKPEPTPVSEPEEVPQPPPPEDRMLKWFDFTHLKNESARNVSALFHMLAQGMVAKVEQGPERTVALRKLLEAKDAAVRATIHPGG